MQDNGTGTADLPAQFGAWRPWPRERSANCPYFERAWKTFEKLPDDASLTVRGADYAQAVGEGALSLLIDFGGEVLGRPVLEFAAAAGTIIDLGYTERLLDDGVADLHNRYKVDMMERYSRSRA